jgi:hypothetical protein
MARPHRQPLDDGRDSSLAHAWLGRLSVKSSYRDATTSGSAVNSAKRKLLGGEGESQRLTIHADYE